jgi:hypothetical protein
VTSSSPATCSPTGICQLLTGIHHRAEAWRYAIVEQEPHAAVDGGAMALLVDVALGARQAGPPSATSRPALAPGIS